VRPRQPSPRTATDPFYPRIERAVTSILVRGTGVAAVNVLAHMGLLAPEKLEDWRPGQVPYLEAVMHCNLTRLSRTLELLRSHSHELNLVPSITPYMRWGKGSKQRLRFTKTGNPRLEATACGGHQRYRLPLASVRAGAPSRRPARSSLPVSSNGLCRSRSQMAGVPT
jgi:hypothetical protein